MRQTLHLVSLPMHDPLQPSAQLGYLHGHAERNLHNIVAPQSHTGHFEILWLWKEIEMRESYYAHRLFGEELFFLACCFEHPQLFERAYSAYQQFSAPEIHASREEIGSLVRALRIWTQHRLIPTLSGNALNIIGFSTTFAQVFASIFVCRELKRRNALRTLFVFGGASVTMPETRRALALWEVDGLVALSNGETPLDALIREIDALPEGSVALDAVAAAGAEEYLSDH